MPGLHFEAGDPGQPWKITAETIDVLVAAFGTEMLNAFIRCLAAADRLMTILDCMQFNDSQAGVDSVRGGRNRNVLGLFAVGLAHELQEGLQQLRDADLASHLSPAGRERWTQLAKFAEFENEDTMLQLRNCMAFHLGDPDIVKRGIQRLSAERRVITVTIGDDGSKIAGRHDFAADVVLAGINIRPPGVAKGTPNSRRRLEFDDLDAAISEARDCHKTMLELFDDVVVDALRQAGANYEPLPPMPPPQTEE